MIIEAQSETADGTRVRLALTTLNLDTHSRIQELAPSKRMLLEDALKSYATFVAHFISDNTIKKTA